MKIVVVGGGNAGILTALHYTHYTKDLHNIEVELVYDPDIPSFPVGQATLIDAPHLLWHSLGYNWYSNKIKAVPKFGILYENWGKKNKKFFHPFNYTDVGLHLDTVEFQKAVLTSGYLTVKKKNIKDIETIDANVIFDCRGKGEDNKDYEEILNPINSCLVATSNDHDPNQYWTRHVATPDGWTFIIPNVDSTSFGYLYNKDITSKTKATKNFAKYFGDYFKHGIISNEVNSHAYIAKDFAREKDNRTIILNGNRFAFIEPMEATSMAIYQTLARYSWDWIIDGTATHKQVNDAIRKVVFKCATFILYHYIKGSVYNTKFWKHAKEMAEFGMDESNTEFYNVMNTVRYNDIVDLKNSDKFVTHPYGMWPYHSFKTWDENVIC